VVNLHELLTQLLQIFSPEAAAKNIQFRVSVDSNLPKFVKTDEKRLRQILTNLLSNAVKFTQQGGVEFRVRYRSQVAEFCIMDTGPGIAAEDMDSIFKPFERIRKPNAPVVAGTGLGLTIVHLLTDIMGGDISVTSTEGEGSCFTLSMMLAAVAAGSLADPEQPAISGYRGPRKTVMVVDDDPVHRGLIIDMLTPLGFQVVEARDAESCLRLIRDAAPDLFLLDVSMPGISGLDLATLLRQRQVQEPIIMISANAQEQPAEQQSKQSYNAYMIKPMRMTTLLDRITQVLDMEWTLAASTPGLRHIDNSGLFELQLTLDAPVPPLDSEVCARLIQHAEIGYARGLQIDLDHFYNEGRIPADMAERIRTQLDRVEFAQIISLLERSRTPARL
jgi:CheY-like chemotaxis protein/anti-sigma regulatory factor (Ser/Thr protein kinase)